ncbi:hypothetical protein QTO34_006522 [Cnephaeus nilssonii]|uniref:Uncharacterized protein n=1 Tax=Cnephaeus nilssonii TaxID=3371016 RepID=A0AA40HLK9_CNENI|nr:hypothetical protein QTO34_006522 [Eptesicus nilssonii]
MSKEYCGDLGVSNWGRVWNMVGVGSRRQSAGHGGHRLLQDGGAVRPSTCTYCRRQSHSHPLLAPELLLTPTARVQRWP